jgi:hypothetical protein
MPDDSPIPASESDDSRRSLEVAMSTSSADEPVLPSYRPRLSVEELIRAKDAKPIRSMADLEAMSAEIFESDDELDEFLAFTYTERRRDVA